MAHRVLVLVLSMALLTPCSGVGQDQLYDYGPAAGDSQLDAADTASDSVHLQVPFVWFGASKTSLFVSYS